MATPVREYLLTSNDEFRRLVQEHQQYSERINNLTAKRYLSDEEQFEETRLKKLKLRLKDEMQNIESQYVRTHPEHVA
jgi:uncharacterized protein YdcH (DUF465 family)